MTWHNPCLDGWGADDMEPYGCIAKTTSDGCRELSYVSFAEGSEGDVGVVWQFDQSGELVWHEEWPCTSEGEVDVETATFGDKACP